MCSLVSCKTATETNNQGIWSNTLKQRNNTRWITLISQPFFCKLYTDIVNKLLFKCHTCIPNLFIWNIVYCFPNTLVALIAHERLIEIFCINLTPFCCCPCWHMHTICNIAHMVFLWIITFPDI